MKKVIIIVLILIMTSIPVHADIEGDWEFSIKKGIVEITTYLGTDAVVEVPELLGGSPVTVVGNNSFKDNAYVEKVILHDGIESLGNNLFVGCANMIELVIYNDNIAMPSNTSSIPATTTIIANVGSNAYNYANTNGMANTDIELTEYDPTPPNIVLDMVNNRTEIINESGQISFVGNISYDDPTDFSISAELAGIPQTLNFTGPVDEEFEFVWLGTELAEGIYNKIDVVLTYHMGEVTRQQTGNKTVDKTDPPEPVINIDHRTSYAEIMINYTGDTYIEEYSFDNVTWYEYKNKLTVTEDTEIYARAEDRAGNRSYSNDEVTNIQIVVEEILVDETIYTNVGETVVIDYEVLPVDSVNADLVWVSSDELVVEVDQHGVLTATGTGVATILVETVDGTVGSEITVYVDPAVIIVTIPIDINFNINPNLGSDSVSETFTVYNDTLVPVEMQLLGIESLTQTKVVDRNKFTDYEWERLGMTDTLYNIAIGITDIGGEETIWSPDETYGNSGEEFIHIGKSSDKDLMLTFKHGTAWETTQSLAYIMYVRITL